MNLVIPKVGAKHKLLFNKPVSAALGVIKLNTVIPINLVTVCSVAYKSDIDSQQTDLLI